ncbi:MAG: AmmeMemoRadiSam system radical SAM enzyme [Candidatus Lambdaproteobacteria bacterium RIFOXYD12_FULL_49_8]|uniref:AmmeMemoRadiSam system radical SAM enzyme n=1 Tax=Candidatus Lambdaproteobacteria bacterium RIFOXYD2_FULL_50_16 TaxID=1817772 RepID=A0A1F6G6J2_9PROT|nr:MAG: AmmeMemoRadiSam system radical SAM enzyme [Candidatus Lambdaproteobacteria bacterium RIFOXYD2_FULL_50_16]OGG96509.1 MAG: AmmeMemoRadiSam system radical SAM enzyme [Candidatus Lambdaproteobacteria bacterium RIFOXYD12_FULL_49_8]
MFYPGKYWQPLEMGLLRCQLCPRSCKIKPGETGFCQNRENLGGELFLNSFGLASGFQLDPIEKKPLHHFYPGSSVLSFGTIGCNLGCRFCQNWGISKKDNWDNLAKEASPQRIAQAAKAIGAHSVALTYNDPTIFIEFAIEVAQACKEAGIKVVLVTAGYINKAPRADLYRWVDAANVDLKAFNESFYRHLCQGHLAPVLETLEYLANETKCWVEVTNLVIEGENDRPEEMQAMASWIAQKMGPHTPLHLSAFHPDFEMKHHPKTSLATLKHLRQIAVEAGLSHVYTGNVHDPEGGRTLCAHCGELLIQRDWYQIEAYRLSPQGYCRGCGQALAGRFGSGAGGASARSQRVQI